MNGVVVERCEHDVTVVLTGGADEPIRLLWVYEFVGRIPKSATDQSSWVHLGQSLRTDIAMCDCREWGSSTTHRLGARVF